MRLRAVAAASALAVICACLSTAGAAAGSSRAAAGITVYAASSLTDAFPAIDKRNSYSFGGSNALATQIANGAPADVFASANTSLPAQLYAAGVVEKPVVFTRNTLVVVVPKSNPARIESVHDLTKPGLKIDVANPAVPVGAYTLQVLDQMGLRASVTPNIVSQETDVRTVLSKVQLGQADAGFVYATDARTVSGQVAVVKVPAWAQPKVAYSLAIVSRSQNKAAAQAFVAEVLSKAGQAKLVGFGFLPVGAPVPTLTAIAPRRGSWGATVTLTGTNFTGATSVTFHGVPARFTVRSATRIVVTVPARARTGRITVTNPAGTATSSTSFRVP